MNALGSQVRSFEDETRSRPGIWLLQLDPLLLVAALGLIAFGAYVVGNATHGDIPGNPDYYLSRQIAYGAVGLVLMLLLARFDYSRLREWKLGIYGATIALILMTLALGTATRGSKRWNDLPFFKLQSSELGKVLLVIALAAFVVDRVRRLSDRETTSRILLLAILPAMLVVMQPDLGSGMVYIAIACAILFVAGTKWTHFLAIGTITATIVVGVLVGAPPPGVHVLKQDPGDRPA